MTAPDSPWPTRLALRWRHERARIGIKAARSAAKMRAAIHRPEIVQEVLDVAIVAGGTYLMRRFDAARRFFYTVHKNTGVYPYQLVSLLLTFPFFQVSQLCFYFVVTAQERQVRRLGGDYLRLEFRDCVVSGGRIGNLLQTLGRINQRLERARARENLADHHLPPVPNGEPIIASTAEGVEA